MHSVSKKFKKWLREFLIEARKRKGLTQAEVDERLGLHQPFASQYESGKHFLNIVEIAKISQVLDVDPHYIIARAQEMREQARSQNDENQEF